MLSTDTTQECGGSTVGKYLLLRSKAYTKEVNRYRHIRDLIKALEVRISIDPWIGREFRAPTHACIIHAKSKEMGSNYAIHYAVCEDARSGRLGMKCPGCDKGECAMGGGVVKEVPVAPIASPIESSPGVEAAEAEAADVDPVTIVPAPVPVAPAIPSSPSTPPSRIHPMLCPCIAITVARGRAKRSSDRAHDRERAARARTRLARGIASGAGPPVSLATGPGPPVPVAVLAVIDGG
jgi:hypothetical protein